MIRSTDHGWKGVESRRTHLLVTDSFDAWVEFGTSLVCPLGAPLGTSLTCKPNILISQLSSCVELALSPIF